MKAGQKANGSNGLQNSLFPMDVMYITQGEGDSFSHGNAKAIDYIQMTKSGQRTYRAPYYAPADVTLIHKGSDGAGVAWATDNEVNTPIGKTKLVYMVWHDNDASSMSIGTKKKQGELLGHTGTAGNVTGDHLHMEIYTGSAFDKSRAIHNWEGVFVNDTEMVNTYNYNWLTTDDNTGSINGSCPAGDGTFQLNEKVNAKVRSYEPMMRAECEKQGIPQAVIPLLALMMVESGGEGGDPMQSSESAGLPMNTIKDPYASIVQGVKHFKESLETSKQYGVDIWTTFQQYNYGIGYAKYISTRGGVNTIALAKEYSRTVVAPSLGNTSGIMVPYVNEISIALGETMRYVNGGNFLYAFMIQYYTTGNGSINECGNNTGVTDKDKNNKKIYELLMCDALNGWKW